MFINIDDVLKGYCTIENKMQVNQILYDTDISHKEYEIKKLKETEETPENKKFHELYNKDANLLTEEEKKKIYLIYSAYASSYNLISEAVGRDPIIVPDYQDVTIDDIRTFQLLLNTYSAPNSKERNIKNLQEQIAESKYYKDNYVLLCVSKDLVFEHKDTIIDMCYKLLDEGKKVKFAVEEDMRIRDNNSPANYLYTKEEMAELVQFNNMLRMGGMEENIRLNEFKPLETRDDYNNSWDLGMVLKANQGIDNIVNSIKRKNLTPYEAMLFIHKHITSNFAYNRSVPFSDSVIMGSMIDKSIICSGYSSLTKAIIDKLDMPELKCDIISCKMFIDKPIPTLEGSHCQCVIHIKDDQYNIDGSYLNDTCWDSKCKDFPKGRGFSNCLIPLEDAMHYKDKIYYEVVGKSRFDQLIINMEEINKYDEPNAKIKDLMFRLKTKFKHPVPNFVTKYGDKSNPIPFETFEKGVTNMFYKMTGFKKDKASEEVLKKMIDDSLINAKLYYNKKSKNCYYKQVLKEQDRLKKEIEEKIRKKIENRIRLDEAEKNGQER